MSRDDRCEKVVLLALLFSASCIHVSEPEKSRVASVVVGPDAHMSATGVARAWVIVTDTNGGHVSDFTAQVSTAGPFSAEWEVANQPWWKRLDITAQSAGTGEIRVTIEGVTGRMLVTASPVQLRTLTLGVKYGCGLDLSDRAWCWGANGSGQLGVATPGRCRGYACQYSPGDPGSAPSPLAVVGGHTFSTIATATRSCTTAEVFVAEGQCGITCALDAAGTPYCWGSSIGITPTIFGAGLKLASLALSTPATPPAPASTRQAVCGLGLDGKAYCLTREASTEIGSGHQFTALGRSANHTCGLKADGDIYCWGSNAKGDLGIGTADAAGHPVPTQVAGGIKFTALAVNEGASCGLATDATVHCWGASPGTASPTRVAGGSTYSALAIGAAGRLCALTPAGGVDCWAEGYGKAPRALDAPEPFSTISVGSYFIMSACGISRTNVTYCWETATAPAQRIPGQ